MNRYPMNQQAQHLAQQGRYGDTTLMHINPDEFAGIAALAGIQPTINPHTGLPEAFSFRDFLKAAAPIAAGIVGTAVGGPVGGALASGATSGAITGDMKRGMASALVGAGIGSAVSGLAQAGQAATTTTLANEATKAATDAAVQTTATTSLLDASVNNAMPSIMEGSLTGGAEALAQTGVPYSEAGAAIASSAPEAVMSNAYGSAGFVPGISQAPNNTLGEKMGNMWTGIKNDPGAFMKNLSKPTTVMPIAQGAQMHGNLDMEEAAAASSADARRKAEEKKRKSRNQLARAYGYAEGGITNLRKMGAGGSTSYTVITDDGVKTYGDDYFARPSYAQGRSGRDIQMSLRGDTVTPPPAGYMHGFMPEWNWFQQSETDTTPPQNTGPGPNPNPGNGDPVIPNYQQPYDRTTPGGVFRNPSRGVKFTDVMQDPLDMTPTHRGDYDYLRDLFAQRYGEEALGRTTGEYAGLSEAQIIDLERRKKEGGMATGGIVNLYRGGGDFRGRGGLGNLGLMPEPGRRLPWEGPLPPDAYASPALNQPGIFPGEDEGVDFIDAGGADGGTIIDGGAVDEGRETGPSTKTGTGTGTNTKAKVKGQPGDDSALPPNETATPVDTVDTGDTGGTPPANPMNLPGGMSGNIYYPTPDKMQPWETYYPPPRAHMQNTQYFEAFPGSPMPQTDGGNTEGMAEGGNVTVRSGMAGDVPVQPGGIANLPQQGMAPSQNDVMAIAMALTGQVEDPGPIVESFIAKYGVDMFRRVRDMIQQQFVGGQPAQNEGVVRGQGTGMQDQVMGSIAGEQPVALSPGEYVVPADVVSGLGDGSTDAGAERLDELSDNVRRARQGGRINQPPPVDPNKVMS